MKSLALGALLVVLGALALLLTAELVLRTTNLGTRGTQAELHELRLDRPWLFGLRPGFHGTLEMTGDVVYEINADGFRGRAYAPTPAPDVFRIVVLGASTTFGWGVREGETWPARLERILDGRDGRRVEVLNLAVNGYNPYNEAALLADRGLAYQPDLVLVEFGVAAIMDPSLLFDAQTRMHPALIPDAALPDPAMRRPPPAYAALLRPCQALRTCTWLVDWLGLGGPADTREALHMLYPRVPSATERAWLARQYGEMARLARSAGAGFAVIEFPHREQLRKKLSEGPQEQVILIGKEGGWPTYDLLPVLATATQDGRSAQVMLDGWHLSAVGHSVAAHAIALWLEQTGLVP
ncbi:MAG TPA: GDSL-type esterase/lipase family protein [Myxococcota bacterium]|nr:GDSL-type esterase/lipase family protein [Myxococcota bacterium]